MSQGRVHLAAAANVTRPTIRRGCLESLFAMPGRDFLTQLAAMLVLLATIALLPATVICLQKDNSDMHQGEHQQGSYSQVVDTKYWIRNMEFGDRDNWASGLRPCTLLEKISIDQNEAVISLGDLAMGSSLIPANVREFVLPKSGLLLLEEDTFQVERDYIDFLSRSGDCFDSSALPEHLQDAHWFRFKPHPDEFSWFNAANWASAQIGDKASDISQVAPDSHLVPCMEDMVVFGSRHAALWLDLETDERSKVFPFKVNFQPSEHMIQQVKSGAKSLDAMRAKYTAARDALRVSKLKIGDKSYAQEEISHLIELYGNYLFDFENADSIFSNKSGSSSLDTVAQRMNALTIDESSVITGADDLELCLDGAGCQCGNEQSAVMELICSFYEPLKTDELPCLDPIQSSGYCDKICGTTLSITMDPNKFREQFVISLVDKLILAPTVFGAPNIQDIFFCSRRVDYNKYEITLRLPQSNNDIYTNLIGKDLEIAESIKRNLEKAASKSFYGIKTISIRSSVLWRRNNGGIIFWLALAVSLPCSTALFAYYDSQLADLILNLANLIRKQFESPSNHSSFISTDELIHEGDESRFVDSQSHDHKERQNVMEDDYAMTELGKETDSTHNLLVD